MRFIALLLRSWNNAPPFQCTTAPLFNDENWDSMQFRSPSYFHRQWKRFRSKKNTASRIMRYAAQLLLNADELIIFGKAIGTRQAEIGRAWCRERVCQYVKISVVAGS